MRILVSDPLSEEGVRKLETEAEVDVITNLSPQELIDRIRDYDALAIRSGTKVTAEVIAATNRPDMLDPALLRPGRFDRLIYVPLPNREGRRAILAIHTASMNLHPDVDLKRIAEAAEGASGADLKALATEAGMFAIREERDVVCQRDFERARSKIADSHTDTTKEVSEVAFGQYA